MNTVVCIALLAACAVAAPAPEEVKRDKRWSDWGVGYSSYGLDAPIVSRAPVVYSAPATVIHEPAIVSVKKIVVSVKKIVSYPHVARVAHYVAAPRVSYSYAPYSSGWW